ncbi:hypothetical protein [Photobacterium chitinilyticum]|uniref:Uncharacterized protein n=1 Tax=Photobacterium chitinilyticum TaxID=2485123 RepID=A0A3S3SZI7_9GAMM|nr:hypothetical protein [Photobacterium chitinilyticum]RWX55579.1 hypothetical protein EDI28_09485 [Photobacterium chitinilyticum]
MSEKKTCQLLQLYFRESERVRLLDLDALPVLDTDEQANMHDWLATKRNFSPDEIASQQWIKTCSAGYITELTFFPDGRLDEYTLFNRQRTTGRWELIDGVIEMVIYKGEDQYRCAVLANRTVNIHSAIEYKNGELHSYLKLAQTRPVEN